MYNHNKGTVCPACAGVPNIGHFGCEIERNRRLKQEQEFMDRAAEKCEQYKGELEKIARDRIARADTFPLSHEACDAFWDYWRENGETHKHGYYESTWGAIRAYLKKAEETENHRAV